MTRRFKTRKKKALPAPQGRALYMSPPRKRQPIPQLAAPCLFSLLIALLKGLAHIFHLVRIAAGQSLGEVQNPAGGLLYAPVAVLGNILLCLQLGSR